MKQVDAFIITSTRAPGKTRKAWYQYILVCNGHTVQKKERVLDRPDTGWCWNVP